MNTGERIAIIRGSAKLMESMELADIDLILEQHGFGISFEANDFGGMYNYVQAMIKDADDEKLTELHTFLSGQIAQVAVGHGPWPPGDGVRLFLSHLAVHQRFVGSIGYSLSIDGVSPFVAHKDIAVSNEWMLTIESALKSCDAMAVILHDGFAASPWCDQEVGFALARAVPIIPVWIDIPPYGFLGKFQAMKAAGLPEVLIAQQILERLTSHPVVQSRMLESTVTAFERSGSYDQTRRLYDRLTRLPNPSQAQCQRLEVAARDNYEISNAQIAYEPGPEMIRKFIQSRGGYLTLAPSQ